MDNLVGPHLNSPLLNSPCSTAPSPTGRYITGVDPADVAPQDAFHLFQDGLLRSEAAWLLSILFKMGMSFSRVNNAISKYIFLYRTRPHLASPC